MHLAVDDGDIGAAVRRLSKRGALRRGLFRVLNTVAAQPCSSVAETRGELLTIS